MNINDLTNVQLHEDGSGYNTNLGSVPKGHRFEAVVLEWEALGNTIEPFDTLGKAKSDKIASIDAQTSIDIELLAGDNNKQKALLAEAVMLERAERLGDTTVSTRLDELFAMNMAIEQLKIDGNTKEALVALCTTINEVEVI